MEKLAKITNLSCWWDVKPKLIGFPCQGKRYFLNMENASLDWLKSGSMVFKICSIDE